MSGGIVSLTFRLCGTHTGGTPLWEEAQSVPVKKGVFIAQFGSVNALNLPFDKPYFLGFSVGESDELTPRTTLTSTPYALAAGNITDSGKVVRMINGLTDTVTVVGAGGTTVTSVGQTLVVTSTPPGPGGGVYRSRPGVANPRGRCCRSSKWACVTTSQAAIP